MLNRIKPILSYLLILIAGLGVGYVAVRVPGWIKPSYVEGDYSSFYTESTKVVLYATATCPFCERARAHLKAKGIPFVEFDINKTKDARHQFEKLDGRAVPVLLVGNRMLTGFNQQAIDDAIAAADLAANK